MIRPSLRWFAVVATLLLIALPAQADDIDPESYVEEAVEPELERISNSSCILGDVR